MSGYDWGVTPQQPAQPAGSTPVTPSQQQQQQPQKKGGVPKGALIAGGAILGVVVIGFGGLMAASALRGGPDNPAGVSDEQAASYFDGYSLSTCDFGEEFYKRAGIQEVEVTENGCTGWTIPEEGQPSVRVWMTESRIRESVSGEPLDGELGNWRSVSAGNIPDQPSYRTVEYGDDASCGAWSSSARMGDWMAASSGPCGTIAPLITQLENLTRQYEWNEADHGLFDSAEHPGYLEVGSPDFDLYSAWAEAEPAEPGTALESQQRDFEGSTIAVDSVRIDGEELCVDATFTLGDNNSAFTNTFYLPDFEVLYGTNEKGLLQAEPTPGLRLEVGESHTYQACGSAPTTVRGGDVLFQDATSYHDGVPAAWRFPASQVAGGETV